MKAKLHLVSMPWADPELPSIQISVLKAYVDAAFGNRVPTRTYSAFASIGLEQTRSGYSKYDDKYEPFEEYPYFLIYLRRYLQHDARLGRLSIHKLIKKVNTCSTDEELSLEKVAHLERRTCRYIENRLGPELSRSGVNVVGFTLNYYQLYASLFCARYLQERFPGYRYLFVFGGATVIYPKVAEVLKNLGLDGLCVIGEGERKLELILNEILTTPADQYSNLRHRLAVLHEGIYDIQRRTMDLYEQNTAALLSLQTPVEKLPLPNFDEYYDSLREVFTRAELREKYIASTWLVMEGSRGCFAHCDFCDVHMSWSGFRKSTPERVVANLLELVRRHGIPRVKFMDNVCDTWAEKYAELLMARKIRIAAFMECRVHHPETFWTKLSLSGVELVQVGIEALSPTLLQAMNKGTRAKQNLLVQKWLKELGIESLSNLISHHPKSTLRHVQETRQILRLIPHLERLSFSNLALLLGTPLDKLLDREERKRLQERQDFELPKSLDRYFVLKGEYEPPAKWFARGVITAWNRLIEWEERFAKARKFGTFMSSTYCDPEHILVRDGRYGKVRNHHLVGEAARIYDLCHQGAAVATLVRDTRLSVASVEENIAELIRKKLLTQLDGFYIALALRPRDELIHNCFAQMSQDRPQAQRDAKTAPAMPMEPVDRPNALVQLAIDRTAANEGLPEAAVSTVGVSRV